MFNLSQPCITVARYGHDLALSAWLRNGSEQGK